MLSGVKHRLGVRSTLLPLESNNQLLVGDISWHKKATNRNRGGGASDSPSSPFFDILFIWPPVTDHWPLC